MSTKGEIVGVTHFCTERDFMDQQREMNARQTPVSYVHSTGPFAKSDRVAKEFERSLQQATVANEYVILRRAIVAGSPVFSTAEAAIAAATEMTTRTDEVTYVLRIDAEVAPDHSPRVVINRGGRSA